MSGTGEIAPARPGKSPAAFRTISEVAEDLDLPPHVLRFWESKFPQLKPLKRGGGRRYYRPEDIRLLRHIRQCLYQDGYTIRGVQKLLGDSEGRAADRARGVACRPVSAEPVSDAIRARAERRRAVAPESRRAAAAPPAKPAARARIRGRRSKSIRRELLEARGLLGPLRGAARGAA